MNDEFTAHGGAWVGSPAELREIYRRPSGRALQKELHALDRHCRHFISRSPFLTLATCGANGELDCSPRGDGPGFVAVLDDRTLLIPDRRGNNRLDSLTNITEHPRVALLFMVPGVDETLRVNGRARITRDPALLAPLEIQRRTPPTGIVVEVESCYLQCAKALLRSRLWDPASRVERASFPTMGQMLADQITGLDGEAFDREASDPSRYRLY